MQASEIIRRFHLYCGDQSELSSQDELDLLNKVYDDVLNTRPWEFLKKNATGSFSSNYITLPADFRYFIENNQKTDNSSTTYNNASPKVIYIGPNYSPVQIVNFSDRRQFIGQSGYAYLDLANNKIVFTWTPTESTYDFDYIKQWEPLAIDDTPIFPADFHDILFHLMCVDSDIINLFDRAHSYARENQRAADEGIKKLCYYNSMLLQN